MPYIPAAHRNKIRCKIASLPFIDGCWGTTDSDSMLFNKSLNGPLWPLLKRLC